ncbi:GNAT family N-acetyltransferase [Streptomyces rimosus]|uniref:GNAT family N-acetyltransferase n=1 Tax=Streptomyces rimosus TaxID=1927 RepID=UPI000AE79892|nr:GNAT family N-acetyltransferase [Streptomyces rimosus]
MTSTEQPGSSVYALLSDGTTVCVRRACPEDRERVLRLFTGMSPENLRLRFFTVGAKSGEAAADRISTGGGTGGHALLALVGDEVTGTAEFHRSPTDPDTADIGLAVADTWHGRGIGTLLLEHLADAARAAGIRSLTADALTENHLMLKVISDLGLRTARRFDGPEVHCTIELTEDELYLSAVDERGRTADVASLEPLLRPASVVVIGAGRSPSSVGRALLTNIRSHGFTGQLSAVNPHADVIDGTTPCYPSVEQLPHVPALAVLAVQTPAVPDFSEKGGKNGVKAQVPVPPGGYDGQGRGALKLCWPHGGGTSGPAGDWAASTASAGTWGSCSTDG